LDASRWQIMAHVRIVPKPRRGVTPVATGLRRAESSRVRPWKARPVQYLERRAKRRRDPPTHIGGKRSATPIGVKTPSTARAGSRDLRRNARLTPRKACCKEPCRPPSSSGPGSGVLSPVTRVQIPLGVLLATAVSRCSTYGCSHWGIIARSTDSSFAAASRRDRYAEASATSKWPVARAA
jgi:hypothetical protein